jgi:hypothetical protein
MRSWYRVNVEEPLNRLPIDWDTYFLYAWGFAMVSTVLAGGR